MNLAEAVIQQAKNDLAFLVKRTKSHANPREQDVADALLFLLATEGEWKEARDLWAEMAELDGDLIRVEMEHIAGSGGCQGKSEDDNEDFVGDTGA